MSCGIQKNDGCRELKVPVECYSRVVGYFRPVNQWNLGKQEEFGERVPVRIPEVIHEKKM